MVLGIDPNTNFVYSLKGLNNQSLEYKRNYSAHPDINTVICDSSNKSCEEDKKGIRNGTF